MNDSLPSPEQMLDEIREMLIRVGKLEASTQILQGVSQLAAEYSASQQVNAILPEADEAEQRVVDAYWAGVKYGIQQCVSIIDSVMMSNTDNSEKSQTEEM